MLLHRVRSIYSFRAHGLRYRAETRAQASMGRKSSIIRGLMLEHLHVLHLLQLLHLFHHQLLVLELHSLELTALVLLRQGGFGLDYLGWRINVLESGFEVVVKLNQLGLSQGGCHLPILLVIELNV